jgi:hypothetical protein
MNHYGSEEISSLAEWDRTKPTNFLRWNDLLIGWPSESATKFLPLPGGEGERKQTPIHWQAHTLFGIYHLNYCTNKKRKLNYGKSIKWKKSGDSRRRWF